MQQEYDALEERLNMAQIRLDAARAAASGPTYVARMRRRRDQADAELSALHAVLFPAAINGEESTYVPCRYSGCSNIVHRAELFEGGGACWPCRQVEQGLAPPPDRSNDLPKPVDYFGDPID
jgi:hypothetical protein